jgi:hypothetical protein
VTATLLKKIYFEKFILKLIHNCLFFQDMFDMLSPSENKADDEPLEEPENGEAGGDPPDKEEVAVGPPIGGVTAHQLEECPHTVR